MGIDRYYTPPSAANKDAVERKAKTMPAVGIYRPPPARRLCSEEASVANVKTEKAKSKPRRPDIQVYVPRAKRASAGGSAATDNQVPSVSNRRHSANVPSSCCPISKLPDSKLDLQQSNDAPVLNANMSTFNTISPSPIISKDVASLVFESEIGDNTSQSLPVEVATEGSDNKPLNFLAYSTGTSLHFSDDDKVIAKEVKKEPSELDCSNPTNVDTKTFKLGTQHSTSYQVLADTCESDCSWVKVKCEDFLTQLCQLESIVDLADTYPVRVTEARTLDANRDESNESDEISELMESIQSINGEQAVNIAFSEVNEVKVEVPVIVARLESCEQVQAPVETQCDVEIIANSDRLQKCDDDEEKCRISEEQNRKNRSIHRGNIYVSDVLLISDREPPPTSATAAMPTSPSETTSLGKPKRVKSEANKSAVTSPVSSKSSAVRLNPDECTWDMLFDDKGDCLDPSFMDELTSKVGNVAIQTPQSDYKSFTVPDFPPRDEFSHVVEIYDFPSEFKTQDLIAVFSSYQSKGFEIKWVDDTHALGVFSNSLAAAEVLKDSHSFLKTRPLHEAAPESRAKARRSSEFLQPYRARPETCPAMARRMVTGALGVRLSTARQEREAERALLKVARDKKKLEARQKDEAWEGTLGGTANPTD